MQTKLTSHFSGFATSAFFRSSLVLMYFTGNSELVDVNPQTAELKRSLEDDAYTLRR